MPDGPARKRLTYEEATPEQRAEARERSRRKLAEARERFTPEYFAEARARLGFPPKEQ